MLCKYSTVFLRYGSQTTFIFIHLFSEDSPFLEKNLSFKLI